MQATKTGAGRRAAAPAPHTRSSSRAAAGTPAAATAHPSSSARSSLSPLPSPPQPEASHSSSSGSVSLAGPEPAPTLAQPHGGTCAELSSVSARSSIPVPSSPSTVAPVDPARLAPSARPPRSSRSSRFRSFTPPSLLQPRSLPSRRSRRRFLSLPSRRSRRRFLSLPSRRLPRRFSRRLSRLFPAIHFTARPLAAPLCPRHRPALASPRSSPPPRLSAPVYLFSCFLSRRRLGAPETTHPQPAVLRRISNGPSVPPSFSSSPHGAPLPPPSAASSTLWGDSVPWQSPQSSLDSAHRAASSTPPAPAPTPTPAPPPPKQPLLLAPRTPLPAARPLPQLRPQPMPPPRLSLPPPVPGRPRLHAQPSSFDAPISASRQPHERELLRLVSAGPLQWPTAAAPRAPASAPPRDAPNHASAHPSLRIDSEPTPFAVMVQESTTAACSQRK